MSGFAWAIAFFNRLLISCALSFRFAASRSLSTASTAFHARRTCRFARCSAALTDAPPSSALSAFVYHSTAVRSSPALA